MTLPGSAFSSAFSSAFGTSIGVVALDARPGLNTSNSYVTVPEADVYFANSVFGVFWDTKLSDPKIQALVTATRAIDRYRFHGSRANFDQKLDFPRFPPDVNNVREFDQLFPFGTTVSIPEEIKHATFEMVIVHQNLSDATTGQIDRDIKIVDLFEKVEIEYEINSNNQFSNDIASGGNMEAVNELLRPWLLSSGGSSLFPISK